MLAGLVKAIAFAWFFIRLRSQGRLLTNRDDIADGFFLFCLIAFNEPLDDNIIFSVEIN